MNILPKISEKKGVDPDDYKHEILDLSQNFTLNQ